MYWYYTWVALLLLVNLIYKFCALKCNDIYMKQQARHDRRVRRTNWPKQKNQTSIQNNIEDCSDATCLHHDNLISRHCHQENRRAG